MLLEYKVKQGKGSEFCQENTLVQQTCSSNNTSDDSTHGPYQIVNTEIRLIILIADKDERLVEAS